MDNLDYLILNELQKDAQIPLLRIAKKLGTSPYTIRKRYEQMKKDGMIKRSVISLDLSKLGYQGKAFLMITNAPNKDKSITIKELLKIKNIVSLMTVVGAFDILAVSLVTDLNSIMAVVRQIKELPSVQQVEITLSKDTAFPINSNFGQTLSKKYAGSSV